MAKTARRLAVAMILVMTVAGRVEAGDSRVRTDNPAIASLIAEASERSATFRDLVGRVDATDGLVFLQAGKCGRGVRACLNLSVIRSGPSRLLRVVVDVKRPGPDVMASIGHELRHALEVLDDASVDSNEKIYFFYRRIGSTSSERFETEAAIVAGDRVRDEVRR